MLRSRASLVFAFAFAFIGLPWLLACGASKPPTREPVAELRVVAVPDNAVVEVNERFVGAARVLDKQPARLKPGSKRVTISAPGYFPHDLELDLPSGVTKVEIKLRPVPP